MKNETIKVTSAVGANEPPQQAPQAAGHLAAAIAVKHAAQARNPEPASVGRDRLREATKEAYPRSGQYRAAQDGNRFVGSGEA